MADLPPFTILCVDDNQDLREALLLILQHEGYRVLEAGTGGEGLRLAREADLVVLDVGLPDISGLEVSQRIKTDAATSLVPVILLSGHYTSSEDKVEGLAGGGDVYLVKPIDHRELLGQIKALLRIRRTELLLQASEERYRLIVESAAEGIQVVDVAGRITFVNERMAHLLGQPVEALQGRTLFEFTEEKSRARVEAILAGRQEVCEQQEFHFRRQDGTDFWALVSATPHRQIAGGTPGCCSW
jgi:PAS domain S-box-containing protein